jgi:hypothetical protein
MALLDEVTRLGIPIEGDRFRKLYAFVTLLNEVLILIFFSQIKIFLKVFSNKNSRSWL